jgi:hypothetical protein
VPAAPPAAAPAGAGALAPARRAALAEVVREARAASHRLAARYGALAARGGPLGTAAAGLAAAKRAHAEALGGVLASLGPPPDAAPAPPPSAVGPARGEGFEAAYDDERRVDGACREAAALLEGHPDLAPEIARVAREAAAHRARLQDLYLRYS